MKHYNLPTEKVIKNLNSSDKGLRQTEAEIRLEKFGRNEIKFQTKPLWQKIIEPFADIFMIVLIGAGVISIFHGDALDAIIIFAIVAINALISYFQEYSTEKNLRELRKTSEQIVDVMRDGRWKKISKSLLVKGDLVRLSEGDKVPADGRILRAESVRVNESMLTGESLPIEKTSDQITEEGLEAYQQRNILFDGSFVISGNLEMIITETGAETEFGKIAKLSAEITTEAPVQKKINRLIKQIIYATTVMAVVCFGLATWRGMDLAETLKFVMSLSVSVVPEGLPIAISIILALGMRRMAGEKALVRNLRAIETVGVVTTIATDKTGTLTENRLTLQNFFTLKSEEEFFEAINLSLNPSQKTNDPLDQALEDFIKTSGKQVNTVKPFKNFSFNQNLAMSGNLSHFGENFILNLKGAPEQIIANSNLSQKDQKKINAKLAEFTSEGFRVLALAKVELDREISDLQQIESEELEFIGIIAVADILRPTSAQAIKEARQAGVSVRMITGDHPETAFFIAQKLGLADSKDQIFDASKIKNLSSKQLEIAVDKARVFARITPESKLKILQILEKNNITAMTGDGVNDVPALAGAHVGFAMGSGSEIAKDASDIVLLDDNFASIITAMREGRIIVSNISKMLFYALSTNAGEALTMIGSLLIGMPLPLVPVQILWINLVTDSALIIPIGLEGANRQIMNDKPHKPDSPILSKLNIFRMILVASLMAAMAITTFSYYAPRLGEDGARTLTFTLLTVLQWSNAFNARNLNQSLFTKGSLAKNRKFLVGLILAIALQLAALFTPLQNLLHVAPVPLEDLAFVSILAFVAPIALIEIHKLFYQKFN